MPRLAPPKTLERKRQQQTGEPSQAPFLHAASSGPYANILSLQRTAGNQAVTNLLQSHGDSAPVENGVPPIVHEVLRSPGQPLDPATRAYFESRLGADLGSIRLHTGREAAHSAAMVGANAYTVGSDIVFAAGHYAPHVTDGRALLAHELTHVLQGPDGGLQMQAAARRARGPQTEFAREFAAREAELREKYGKFIPLFPENLAAMDLEVGFASGFAEALAIMDPAEIDQLQHGFRDPRNAAWFGAGELVGIVIGIGEDIFWQLKGLLDIGALLLRHPELQMTIAMPWLMPVAAGWYLTRPGRVEFIKQVIAGLWEFYKAMQADPTLLLVVGEDLGLEVGKIVRDWYWDKVISEPDYYWKGVAVGEVIGIIAAEIALLILAPEELILKGAAQAGRGAGAAARGAAGILRDSKFGRSILRVLERIPAFEKILTAARQTEKAAEGVRATSAAAGVVTDVSKVEETAEETRRAAAGIEGLEGAGAGGGRGGGGGPGGGGTPPWPVGPPAGPQGDPLLLTTSVERGGRIPSSPPNLLASESNRHLHLLDERGRPMMAEGWLYEVPASRVEAAQELVSGGTRGMMHASHLIPARYGGMGLRANLVPLRAETNLSPIKVIENSLADPLRNGVPVYLQVYVRYGDEGQIPAELTYHIYEAQAGNLVKVREVSVSFAGEVTQVH